MYPLDKLKHLTSWVDVDIRRYFLIMCMEMIPWKLETKDGITLISNRPITLYEIGGLYFVRDGNHRVSVAKSRGCEMIDAEVISLQSEIKLKAGMSKNKIL